MRCGARAVSVRPPAAWSLGDGRRRIVPKPGAEGFLEVFAVGEEGLGGRASVDGVEWLGVVAYVSRSFVFLSLIHI